MHRLRTTMAAERQAKLLQLKTDDLTQSCRSLRLRLARRDDWNKARRETYYWRARLDWETALRIAQMWNVAESRTFAEPDSEMRATLLSLWRTALANQMLTPAPTMSDVAWKQAQLKKPETRFINAKPETLAKAIADDIEWLAAHPTRRRSKGEAN
jgi:hypothetical protein